MSRASRGMQMKPVFPSTMSSRKEPTSLAMTGTPKLYARNGTPLWKIWVYGMIENVRRLEIDFNFLVGNVLDPHDRVVAHTARREGR